MDVSLNSSEQRLILNVMQFFAENLDPCLYDKDEIKNSRVEWLEIAEDMGFDEFNALFEKILYSQK